MAEIEPPAAGSAERLRRQVSGSVLTREDPGYDETRRGWGLAIDHHPALILVPDDTADVATGVRFAGDAGLGVGVQSTGHGVLYPTDDSLLIVTSRMVSAQVDVRPALLGSKRALHGSRCSTPRRRMVWHRCSDRRLMSEWSATCWAAASAGWGAATASDATACVESTS